MSSQATIRHLVSQVLSVLTLIHINRKQEIFYPKEKRAKIYWRTELYAQMSTLTWVEKDMVNIFKRKNKYEKIWTSLSAQKKNNWIPSLPAWLLVLIRDLCTDQDKLALLQMHLQVQPPRSSPPPPINDKWF